MISRGTEMPFVSKTPKPPPSAILAVIDCPVSRVADDGSTGESNNLNLGSCSSTSGSSPYIEFTESN